MSDIPLTHKEESLKLNPKELVNLFTLTLKSGAFLRLHSGREYAWHPTNTDTPWTFESAYIEVSGAKRSSGEQRIRPTLTLGNPNDIFHESVAEGYLEGAEVIRYRVNPSMITANPPQYEKTTWYIAQVTGLGEVITCQLRSRSDRQEGQMPPREYLPPEFPNVVI